MLTNQPSPAPTRKVAATGIAGAIAVAIVAAVNYYNPAIGAALEPTITAAVTAAIAFIGGYMTRERG